MKYFALIDELYLIYAFLCDGDQCMSMAKTVTKFLEKLFHSSHIIYLDKWFGGLDSVNEVLAHDYHFTFSCKKTHPTQLQT